MRNQIVVALLIVVIVVAGGSAWYFGETRYKVGAERGIKEASNLFNSISFTSQELQTFQSIKDRLTIYNADPAFPGERNLEWVSMRNSTAASWDKPMKSMEYLCFWTGQGGAGEWESVVSIYNSPGSTTDYVVEVARFTWHQIQVKLDGQVVADFPQVTNDTVSLGYTTFIVKA